MAATKWQTLRDDVIRRELRDEADDISERVFEDDEILRYFGNAIRAYSRVIPREISEDIAFIAGLADYAVPEDCRSIISIKAGDTEYTVTEIFAGKMTLSPIPTATGAAKIKYLGCHSIPTAEDEAGSYDAIDEPLLVLFVRAQCCETLAGDGAKYYRYVEGDITEEQGKTQAQFRAEANSLYAEFQKGLGESAETAIALRSLGCSPMVAGVVSRIPAKREAGIYKKG
jgi:hypothetical protein